MRLPLSMVAGMAGYIAKNKLRPNPEWQKTVAPPKDPTNPFKIVYTHVSSAAAQQIGIDVFGFANYDYGPDDMCLR